MLNTAAYFFSSHVGIFGELWHIHSSKEKLHAHFDHVSLVLTPQNCWIEHRNERYSRKMKKLSVYSKDMATNLDYSFTCHLLRKKHLIPLIV